MAVSDEKKCSVLIAAITLRIEEHRSSSRALLSSPPRKNRYRLERSYDTLKIDTHLCYMYIGLRLIASPFSLLFFFHAENPRQTNRIVSFRGRCSILKREKICDILIIISIGVK